MGENGIFVHNGCGIEEVSTNNISNESASKGKRWQVGDPIDAPTASGKNPKWSTVRQRYWKMKLTIILEIIVRVTSQE